MVCDVIQLSPELQDLLNTHKFGWFGQKALDCIGLHKMLNFEIVICCDYGLDTELISAETGTSVISLERKTGVREKWNNFSLERLLERETLSGLSAFLSSRQQSLDILAYCSTEGLEELAVQSSAQVRILAARAFLKRSFDNKITLRAVLPALGIEPVPGHVARLGSINLQEVDRSYGIPFVVQCPIGASGSDTHVITTEAQFESLQNASPDQDVIVSEYIRGLSPNVNAVVLADAILLSYPSIQLIGTHDCTDWPTRYCGNDFSATQSLPKSTIRRLWKQAGRIGDWLRQNGFRGLFGVDFVMDEAGLYPVEVNPRFQGSTHVLTLLHIMRGEPPLALAHVLEFLKRSGETFNVRLPLSSVEPEPLQGSHLILYSRESAQCIVQGLLRPGVYTWKDETIVYQRDGLTILDCHNVDEFVITCAVPAPDTQVEPGAPLLRIQSQRQLLDVETKMLQPWASKICKRVYEILALSPKRPLLRQTASETSVEEH